MSLKSITRPLNTTEITIMSNVSTVQAKGSRITRIEASQQTLDSSNQAAIHLTFDVDQPEEASLPNLLQSTQSLGLILNLEDAFELGLLLVAMGLVDQNDIEASQSLDRLAGLMNDLQNKG